MLKIKPIASSRFEGAVELSDLPAELHAGLKRYANQSSCESDGEGSRLVAVDFEGAATDHTLDATARAVLEGKCAQKPPVDCLDMDAQGWAAHLLAARYLKTVLGSNVVFQDRIAIRC